MIYAEYGQATLRYGSRGGDVSTLQTLLNRLGYNLVVDGIFGPRTRDAVIDFQKKYGLTPDGIVGPMTWSKLYEVTRVEKGVYRPSVTPVIRPVTPAVTPTVTPAVTVPVSPVTQPVTPPPVQAGIGISPSLIIMLSGAAILLYALFGKKKERVIK